MYVLRKKIFPKYFFQHNIMKQTNPLSVENRLLFHYRFAEFWLPKQLILSIMISADWAKLNNIFTEIMLLYISFKRKKTFFRALQPIRPITTTLLLVEPFREKPTIHTIIFLHNFHSIARGLGKGVVPQLIRIDIQAANIYTTIIRVPLIARTYDVQRTR